MTNRIHTANYMRLQNAFGKESAKKKNVHRNRGHRQDEKALSEDDVTVLSSTEEQLSFDPDIPDTSKGDFYCRVCDSHNTTEVIWTNHVTGKRHLKNRVRKPNELPSKAKTIKLDIQAKLYEHLNKLTEPIIGLNCVSELQRPSCAEQYTCFACGATQTILPFIEHICSTKHRLTYIRQVDEEGYEILTGMQMKGEAMDNIVEEHSRMIEEREGRGKIEVKMEKQKCLSNIRTWKKEIKPPGQILLPAAPIKTLRRSPVPTRRSSLSPTAYLHSRRSQFSPKRSPPPATRHPFSSRRLSPSTRRSPSPPRRYLSRRSPPFSRRSPQSSRRSHRSPSPSEYRRSPSPLTVKKVCYKDSWSQSAVRKEQDKYVHDLREEARCLVDEIRKKQWKEFTGPPYQESLSYTSQLSGQPNHQAFPVPHEIVQNPARSTNPAGSCIPIAEVIKQIPNWSRKEQLIVIEKIMQAYILSGEDLYSIISNSKVLCELLMIFNLKCTPDELKAALAKFLAKCRETQISSTSIDTNQDNQRPNIYTQYSSSSENAANVNELGEKYPRQYTNQSFSTPYPQNAMRDYVVTSKEFSDGRDLRPNNEHTQTTSADNFKVLGNLMSTYGMNVSANTPSTSGDHNRTVLLNGLSFTQYSPTVNSDTSSRPSTSVWDRIGNNRPMAGSNCSLPESNRVSIPGIMDDYLSSNHNPSQTSEWRQASHNSNDYSSFGY